MKRYAYLAQQGDRRKRCLDEAERGINAGLRMENAADAERRILAEFDDGPSGSGIDCGTKTDLNDWDGRKIVFYASFHHMNDSGYYDGWTEHVFTVYPSLLWGFDMKISGPNRNDIKEYLNDVYSVWLNEDIGYPGF